MTLAAEEIRRGTVAWAAFPFALQFPLIHLDGSEVSRQRFAVLAQGHSGGEVTHGITSKLRPVLIFHDAARSGYDRAMILRIGSVKQRDRESEQWPTIEAGKNPAFLLLQAGGKHGLTFDSLIDVTNITTVARNAFYGRAGLLDHAQMKAVNARMALNLQLDLSDMISRRVQQILVKIN